MKVLQVAPRYRPFLGGVEAVVEAAAVNLRGLGHTCEVVCADVPAGAPPLVGGVRVTRLPVAFSIANTQLSLGLPRYMWRADHDVVHAHLPTPWWADVAVVVGRLRGKRTVLTFYNDIVGSGAEAVVASLYRATVQRLTLRCADVIIVVSDSRRERLLRRRPGLAPKVVTIPCGVDEVRFSPPADPADRTSRILFAGRLDRFHRYKGFDVLLCAMAAIPGAELDVVGDGELRSEYTRLAADLGIASRVRFLGDVGSEELPALFRAACVFVLPSNGPAFEGGSSLVVLEAMASGTPVVVAQGAGDIAREAERCGGGLSVPVNDPEALAAAVSKLLANPDVRAAMGACARRYVLDRGRWSAAVTRYVDEAYTPPEWPSPNLLDRAAGAAGRIPGDRRGTAAAAGRLVARGIGRRRPPTEMRYRDRHGYRRVASPADHMEVVGRVGLEERLPRAARAAVKPGDWVVDVGANVGLVTAELCRLAGPGGVVWAIEPIPRNLARLEQLRDDNGLGQLRIMAGALSDRTGRAPIRLPVGGASGWASFTKSWDTAGELDVQTWRLDDLAEGFPDRRLALLKLDVEGFEPQVVAGAASVLTLHRPVVVCELNEVLLGDAGSSADAVLRQFADLGFQPVAGAMPRRRRTWDVLLVSDRG